MDLNVAQVTRVRVAKPIFWQKPVLDGVWIVVPTGRRAAIPAIRILMEVDSMATGWDIRHAN